LSEYLFPHRLTRRDFLRWTGAAGLAAGLADSTAGHAGAAAAPVTIGSGKFTFTLDEQWGNPTDVAVAPNGDIYVVNGYGSQLMHRFDKNFKLIKTIGGPGREHGRFNTCHGVWVGTLRKEPEVYVADRANNRVEVYSLDLSYLRTVPEPSPTSACPAASTSTAACCTCQNWGRGCRSSTPTTTSSRGWGTGRMSGRRTFRNTPTSSSCPTR
jgi:hypothetical protein